MSYGTTSTYSTSFIKASIDAWTQSKAPAASESRLITLDELKDNLGYVLDISATSESYNPSSSTPSLVYNSDYHYWTGSQYLDLASNVWSVNSSGSLLALYVGSYDLVVRPVITIKKSAL